MQEDDEDDEAPPPPTTKLDPIFFMRATTPATPFSLSLLLFHSPPSFTHIFLMFHTPPQTLQSVLRKLLEQPRQYVADVCFEYPQGKIYAHRGMNGEGGISNEVIHFGSM